jgi:signal transduction histidine kinase/predicted hydrocarbon binding protein
MMTNQDNPSFKQRSPGIFQFDDARMVFLDIESGFWSIRRQVEALLGPYLTNSIFQQAGVNGGASFAKSFLSGKVDERSTRFQACLQAFQAAGFGQFEIKNMDWSLGRIVIRATDAFEAWITIRNCQTSQQPVCSYTAGVLIGFFNVISSRRDVVCIEHHCQALGDEFCEFELLPAAESNGRTMVAFTPNPKLGSQTNFLELLFDRMPMGIAIFDRQYRFQRYNPTWEKFSNCYAPPSANPLAPGVYYFDLLPGSEPIVIPLFERVLAGETIRQEALRFESGGIVSYWDVVLAPLTENGEVSSILNVTIDVTEQVRLRQNLEQRVEERTRELQILLNVASTANSLLGLDELLATTLDQLVALVGASRAGVVLLNELTGELEARIIRPELTVMPEVFAPMLQTCEKVIATSKPLLVTPELERGLVEPGALLPIRIRGNAIGVLVIIGREGDVFNEAQLPLFNSIADQLSIAIDNARLFDQARQSAILAERSRLARDLHDAVTQTLFSSSLIADVLPKLWERNPEAGKQKLEELRQLTRGALSEMRTLLMELRPSALAEADMDELFRHLVNAHVSRGRLKIRFETQGEETPPIEVKEVFYRVAQEALNNIEKHAGAQEVLIRLRKNEGSVELLIRDDGCGFDPEAVPQEHMGLGIMRERANGIGARLTIQSAPGKGTELMMYWKEKEKRDDK